MNRMFRLFILASLVCYPAISGEAGILTWLFGPSGKEKYQRDTGSNITAHARATIAELRLKASVEHKPAIQVGEIHSSITKEAVDKHWFGDLKVRVKANYSATYGMPYDLIEKGIRIEKDYTTTGLIVIVSGPVPLSVAVDTRSVYVEHREKSGLRTWNRSAELQIDAQRWLTERASGDAQHRCRNSDSLEMARTVVFDLVLDMAGDLYSKKMKRVLAPRTIVVFEHELDLKDFQRRTMPPTPFEIDTRKNNSARTRSER
jgi:hypothetical protein